VVGQDQKYLGALVIPVQETVEEYAKENGIPYQNYEQLMESEEIYSLIMDEITCRIGPKRGFKLFERINRIKLLPNPFVVGIEMNQIFKLKRNVISEKYKKEISSLFA